MPEVLDQQALATALSSLWWPLLALGFVLVFQKDIRSLAARLLKVAGTEFEPQRPEKSSVEAVIESAAGAPPEDAPVVVEPLRLRVPTSVLWEEEIRNSEPLRSTTDPAAREGLLLAFAGRLAVRVPACGGNSVGGRR